MFRCSGGRFGTPPAPERHHIDRNYPVGGAEEDYFVWGPASLIYYPEKQNPEAIQPGLYAAVLNSNTVSKIFRPRERQQYDNRKNIVTYPNYRNILILTQPTSNSCVHTIGWHPARILSQ